jgi:hypothetical protein
MIFKENTETCIKIPYQHLSKETEKKKKPETIKHFSFRKIVYPLCHILSTSLLHYTSTSPGKSLPCTCFVSSSFR